MKRRNLLISLASVPCAGTASGAFTPAPVRFPDDFGAHPSTRTEWWYVTGWLKADAQTWGFQVTFFRSATRVAPGHPSRFAANQLLFAHAALTDLGLRRQWHDQRIARSGFGVADAAEGRTALHLRDWHLHRDGAVDSGRYTARVASPGGGWALDLTLTCTQPPLLQGDAGLSAKGPAPGDVSRYYSEPQLRVTGSLTRRGTPRTVTGTAWLDHEWSDAFVPDAAVGWDWVGMNLDDGAALTAFRLRRPDGTSLYAGGSFRPAGGATQVFGPGDVVFTPQRRWRSPASKAEYPVEWTLQTPQGVFRIAALMDAQELDSRASTGAWYWEGLSELRTAEGRPVGRGYLEMTGYADRLSL